MYGSTPPARPDGIAEGRSFRAYIISRRYGSVRRLDANWRFVIRAMGEEALLAAGGWSALKRALADAPAEDLKAARMVWRSYERWRDGRDSPNLAAPRLPC